MTDSYSGWPKFRDSVKVTDFDLNRITTLSTDNTISMASLCCVSPFSKTHVTVTGLELAELATLFVGGTSNVLVVWCLACIKNSCARDRGRLCWPRTCSYGQPYLDSRPLLCLGTFRSERERHRFRFGRHGVFATLIANIPVRTADQCSLWRPEVYVYYIYICICILYIYTYTFFWFRWSCFELYDGSCKGHLCSESLFT